ncbi:MAG: mechanosensitive ion channel domain-containing protein [Nitrospinales bacterium]
MLDTIYSFINSHPLSSYLIAVFISGALSPLLRMLIGRLAFTIAIRTETVVDDLIVDALRPFRFVYVLPVAIGLFLVQMAHPYTYTAKIIWGLLFIILVIDTVSKLLNGLGEILRHKAGSTSSSYAGIIDIAKLGVVILGFAVIIAIFFETSPLTLLSGIGAFAAVLMLIFKDTMLSIIANIQIASWNHFREGDWIIVPAFGADGIVERIGLYDIKLRNWDMTTSLIPTHKILYVETKNYRSMQESRARHIKRSLHIDLDTVHFCDRPLLERLVKVDHIAEEANLLLKPFMDEVADRKDFSTSITGKTNLDMFRLYADKYLRQHDGIHQKKRLILVRDREPGPEGLPVQIWAFTKKVDLPGYEATQSSIFSHLIGVLYLFDLKIFQRKVGGND